MNRREIYQALLDGEILVDAVGTEVVLDDDGMIIDQYGNSHDYSFSGIWNINLNVKRYWRWMINEAGWCKSEYYLDDDSIDTNGHDWSLTTKLERKIEDDYIDINSKGELV